MSRNNVEFISKTFRHFLFPIPWQHSLKSPFLLFTFFDQKICFPAVKYVYLSSVWRGYYILCQICHQPSKYLLVLKTSSRCLQRNNFSSWRRLQDMSSRHVFKTFSRCLLGMFYWEYLPLKNLKSVSDEAISHISECKMH